MSNPTREEVEQFLRKVIAGYLKEIERQAAVVEAAHRQLTNHKPGQLKRALDRFDEGDDAIRLDHKAMRQAALDLEAHDPNGKGLEMLLDRLEGK